MAKPNFQQPFLQSLVSYDPLEIILICWRNVFIFMILEMVVLLNTFVKTDSFFSGFLVNRKLKKRHLFKIDFLVVLLMY